MSPLFLLAAACALAYLPLTVRPVSPMRSILKTLSVAWLALAVAIGQGPVMLCVALGLCALGDGLLSRNGDRAFMAGIGAFAAGHLAYIALFLTHPLSVISRLGHTPQIWAVAGFLLLGGVAAFVLAPRAGGLRLPVLGYIPIILGMGVASMALPGLGALIWVFPAALAFVASDLVLAGEKFLLSDGHAAHRVTPYAIWPLYWGAQAGFFVALA